MKNMILILVLMMSIPSIIVEPIYSSAKEIVVFSSIDSSFQPEFIELNTSWPMDRDNWNGELLFLSTFGPRLKASENYRYDYHRGIDIPGDYGTPVYAIDDGYVRLVSINDSYQQRDDGSIGKIYDSTVIQLKHNNTKDNRNNGLKYYYSNYLHVNASTIQVDANNTVIKGQLLGYIGDDPNSNTSHLHFEIREGGAYRQNSTHPLQYLPNSNDEFIDVTTFYNSNRFISDNILRFNVSTSNQELDFQGFNLTGKFNDRDVIISFDLSEINHRTEEWIKLDIPDIKIDDVKINIHPIKYTKSIDTANYEISVIFENTAVRYNLTLDIYDIFEDISRISIRNTDETSSISTAISGNADETSPISTVISGNLDTSSISTDFVYNDNTKSYFISLIWVSSIFTVFSIIRKNNKNE